MKLAAQSNVSALLSSGEGFILSGAEINFLPSWCTNI